MKASEFLSTLGDTVKALGKIALLSRKVRRATAGRGEIVILANGPSLRRTLEERADDLSRHTLMCVNFMANTPQMWQLRPMYYVLADPHFFKGLDHDNVSDLWRNIARVDWPMTLCVPVKYYKTTRRLLGEHTAVQICTFNFVGIEAFAPVERLAFSRGWAMPRPRNVLMPAIMSALAAGFSTIYIAGADHSWMESIRVDEDNNVVSVQPHFYADSKAETKRSIEEYRGYRLHDIINSFYVAFRSYHAVERYARRCGIDIFNSTPGSYIDAFRRKQF